MTNFDDIRPYNDDEVRPTLDRVLKDPEFRTAIARLNYPKLVKFFPGLLRSAVAWYLGRELRNVNSVYDLQTSVDLHMQRMINRTVTKLSSSGIDKLKADRAYLFVSNHRDIAMDPAFVDYSLFHNGQDTVRIAIGDNLLTKPYVSDLMRLNKSFIVNRSAKGNKEKFKALKHLSAYIHHSISVDKAHCWIAQREGRAKDGLDRTNTAIITMFAMNRPKTEAFADYIRELHIVPVSISYEWDACDMFKARELYELKTQGKYEKAEHEDVYSLAQGIAGFKGHVHISFGEELTGDFQDAEEVAAEIDRQVIKNYVLHPSNCFAYRAIYGKAPEVLVGVDQRPFREADFKAEARIFAERLRGMEQKYRPFVREMYANPVVSKLAQTADTPPLQRKFA